ncbi:MAG: hypothetical protein KGH93_03650, partial [Patescibacteria group bacterium]|nr:hypothetical protein [Patescibacteria group bacterium]
MTLYKFTELDGSACHGGTGRWTLGRWRSVRGPLVVCEHGLHVLRADQLVSWLAPALWEAEVDGELLDDGDKLVARRARITTRVESWN